MADQDDDLFDDSDRKHSFDGSVCEICGVVHEIEVSGDVDDATKSEVRSITAEILADETSGNQRIGRIIVGRVDDDPHGHDRKRGTHFASGMDRSIRRAQTEAHQAAAFISVAECLDELTGGELSRKYREKTLELDLLYQNYMESLIKVIIDVFVWDIEKGSSSDFSEADESDQAQLFQYFYSTARVASDKRKVARDKYIESCSRRNVEPLESLLEGEIFHSTENPITGAVPVARALMGDLRTSILEYLSVVNNALQLRNEIAEKDNGASSD